MIFRLGRKLVSAIGRIGADPDDDEELHNRKTLFVAIILLLDIPTSVILGVYYLSTNEVNAALTHGAWATFDLGNIIFFAFHRRNFYPTVRRILFAAILVPLAITVLLGGIFASGAYIIWSLVVPVGAAIFLGWQAVWRWTAIEFAALLIAAVMDHYVRPSSIPLDDSIVISFALNILSVIILISVGIFYSTKQREQALELVRARTQELQEKNEELNNKNRELAESREELLRSAKRTELVFAALSDALPGTVLDDKYQLEEKIGSGGFGTVYRATHLLLQSPVAVKVFRPNFGTDPVKNLERFRIEGISASRVRHPNAVTVLDFGVSASSIAYMVMELLQGWSLKDEIDEKTTLSVARCIDILVPVCRALAEAHAMGIVHRDIKPSNIFLHQSKEGEIVKVVDFGIAKLVSDTLNPEFQSLTETGSILGTPVYMSPERLSNKPYDGEADIYSLGVMVYEMLCGRLPFESSKENYWSIVLMHMTHTPISPRRINPKITEDLEAVMMRALAKDPRERPAAKELEQLLKKFASTETDRSPARSSVVFRKHPQPSTTIRRATRTESMQVDRGGIQEPFLGQTSALGGNDEIQEDQNKDATERDIEVNMPSKKA